MARIDTFEIGKTYLYRDDPYNWQATTFGEFLGIITEREGYRSNGVSKWRNVRKARFRQTGVILDNRAHEGMNRRYDESEDRMFLTDLPSEIDEHIVLPRHVEGEFDSEAYNEMWEAKETQRQYQEAAFAIEVKKRLIPALRLTTELLGQDKLPYELQRLNRSEGEELILKSGWGVGELRLLANVYDAINERVENWMDN